MLGPAEQRGITLLELMVGSTLGLLLLSTLVSFYAHNVTSTGAGLHKAYLHQQLQATMALMKRDLRRAGYYGVAPRPGNLHLLASNPFTDADNSAKPADRRNDLRIGAYTRNRRTEASQSCILYSYDLNGDGQVQESGTGMERFGFRLRDERIQMRYGGRDFSCSGGSWRAVTDASIRVTELRFSIAQSWIPANGDARCSVGKACLLRRAVDLTLAAHLKTAPDSRLRLQHRVVLHNDKFLSALPTS